MAFSFFVTVRHLCYLWVCRAGLPTYLPSRDTFQSNFWDSFRHRKYHVCLLRQLCLRCILEKPTNNASCAGIIQYGAVTLPPFTTLPPFPLSLPPSRVLFPPNASLKSKQSSRSLVASLRRPACLHPHVVCTRAPLAIRFHSLANARSRRSACSQPLTAPKRGRTNDEYHER